MGCRAHASPAAGHQKFRQKKPVPLVKNRADGGAFTALPTAGTRLGAGSKKANGSGAVRLGELKQGSANPYGFFSR
jgi:hypothetical protein